MNQADAVPALAAAIEADYPRDHGRHRVRVACDQGMVTLSVDHVVRRWMPFSLFGNTVMTKVFRLLPQSHGEAVAIVNNAKGLRLAGGAAETFILTPQWDSALRNDAHRQILRSLHRPARRFGFAARSAAVLAGAYAVYIASYMGIALSTGAAEADAAQRPAAMPVAAQQSEAIRDAVAMSSAALADRAVASHGTGLPLSAAIEDSDKIVLRAAKAGGKSIVVWSDPLCPNCRSFESKVLSALPPDVGVTIVPVAFKEGSRPLVSYVACGSNGADQAARWTNVMSDNPNADLGDQCPIGPVMADTNTILFARAGLNATPTIASADGLRTFTGDKSDAGALAAWIAQ